MSTLRIVYAQYNGFDRGVLNETRSEISAMTRRDMGRDVFGHLASTREEKSLLQHIQG
jgi:hypothetical protein